MDRYIIFSKMMPHGFKMLNFLKLIYRFNMILMQFPIYCFRIWQADAKVYMEVQSPKNIQDITEQEEVR